MILAASGDVPGGLATVLVALITTLGGVAIAIVGVYRNNALTNRVKEDVNGRMSEILRQLEAEHERTVTLAAKVAVYEERERQQRGDVT
jgi:biopolymer transport protein ExbB/TolQ